MLEQSTDTITFKRVVKADKYEFTVSVSAFVENSNDATVMAEAGKALDKIFDDSRSAFFE